jgi:hypothetical protein
MLRIPCPRYHIAHRPRSRRLSRGRPRAPLLALLYPILSGISRLRSTALCLAPGRVDGAAAARWARGRSCGEGEPLAGGCDIRCTCHRGGTGLLAWSDAPSPPTATRCLSPFVAGGQPLSIAPTLCNLLRYKSVEEIFPTGISFASPCTGDAVSHTLRQRHTDGVRPSPEETAILSLL